MIATFLIISITLDIHGNGNTKKHRVHASEFNIKLYEKELKSIL